MHMLSVTLCPCFDEPMAPLSGDEAANPNMQRHKLFARKHLSVSQRQPRRPTHGCKRMVLRDSPPHLFHNPLQLSGSKCVSMSGHANCIPAPTPPASCTFTCLKGRWMRVTAVCAQQKPQHLNNLNHAAPKGTFVNVQTDRCRQQQLLRRFTATVHKRITSCIRVRVDTSLRSAPKHAVHMPLAMPVYTHTRIYTYLSLYVQLSQAVRLQIRGHSAPHCQFKGPAATGGTPMDC